MDAHTDTSQRFLQFKCDTNRSERDFFHNVMNLILSHFCHGYVTLSDICYGNVALSIDFHNLFYPLTEVTNPGLSSLLLLWLSPALYLPQRGQYNTFKHKKKTLSILTVLAQSVGSNPALVSWVISLL